MNIQVMVDNKNSWMVPYAEKLTSEIIELGHTCELIHEHSLLKKGDILFLLSCEKIITREHLDLHKNNLVVHESALPHGKGWSPLTWQILEGKHDIPITLFEADVSVDAGPIYLRDVIKLQGHELIEEIRALQGRKTIELGLIFVRNYNQMSPSPQSAENKTFYKRRRPEDSKLDVDKTIKEQFNLLRVCDNNRYPAFFEIEGHKYIVTIAKEEKNEIRK